MKCMKNSRTTKIVSIVAGIIISLGITWAAFTWGVYYARTVAQAPIIDIEPEINLMVTNEFVKVMNSYNDSVPFAIWHNGYLYTPDTLNYERAIYGRE